MRGIRIVIALAFAALAIGWAVEAPGVSAKVAGALLFGVLGAAAAVPGLGRNMWLEMCTAIGVLLPFVEPRLAILGGLLLAPLIMIVVGRLWSSLQSEVVTAAKRKETRN